MQNKQNIKIVYTPTNETVFMTIVSIQSLIANNRANVLDLYIVVDEFFEKHNLSLFSSFQKKRI